MVTTKLNLSMTEPSVRQIYAKQGDTGRVLDITLDQTPEDGTLRILRPDGVEVTSEAVTGGEVESGGTFESLTEADVTELTVGIEPVQDLSHGGPSPSNICPITGHDEVRVFDTAEQMYDPSQVVIGRNWTGGSADNRAVFEFVPTPNVSYEIVTVGGNFSVVLFMQLNGGGAQMSNIGIPPSDTPKTITIAENCNRAVIQFNKNSAITTSDFLDFECSVSTKTTTYTTSLGQTVYGGTLDMVSGVLTVDRAMVDLGTLKWSLYSVAQGNLFRSSNLNAIGFYLIYDSTAMICSNYPVVKSSRRTDKSVSVGANNAVDVIDSSYSDPTAFKTAMNGVQLVYELASPQTYTLTAQQIKTLIGTNNVWASSGDIVSIKFSYGGLLSELPSDATSIVGKCYCDVEQNGASSMPFTLNVKKNERAT